MHKEKAVKLVNAEVLCIMLELYHALGQGNLIHSLSSSSYEYYTRAVDHFSLFIIA